MRLLIPALLLCLTLPQANAQDAAKAEPELKKPSNAKEMMSYSIGMNIGRQLKSNGMKLDPKMIALGIATIMEGAEPLVTDEQIAAAQAEFQAMMEKEKLAEAENNKAAAVKFLAGNAKKEGVQSTKTGIQYMVLKEGEGAAPKEADTVSTHYRGKLISGKVFDESYKGDAPTAEEDPVSFPLNRVIPGWTEALQLMKPGAKYRLFIPPALAYGEQGPPGIGPNSLLIFDIELISVK